MTLSQAKNFEPATARYCTKNTVSHENVNVPPETNASSREEVICTF